MATLKNHPGHWLRDDAAAAFDRAEADHGKFVVNSAGRTAAEQQALINRWRQGGTYNRPPYLYEPANPPESSNHVANGGIAIDIGDWRRFAAIAAAYGFSHPYPSGDPVHFEYVGGSKTGDQVTKDRQNWLNSRGWSLVEDGIEGSLTRKAYEEYQSFLKNGWGYKGELDGIWGDGMQAAHQRFYDSLHKPQNPFGIGDVQGLQKIARLYGYKGQIDNIWGAGSAAGFAQFLRRNHGYAGNDVLGPVMWRAIARWLRGRWGYVGNDTPGPVMRAALTRANDANAREL